MILTKEQTEGLRIAAEPLMKFLRDFHPHVEVRVDSESAELSELSARVISADTVPLSQRIAE